MPASGEDIVRAGLPARPGQPAWPDWPSGQSRETVAPARHPADPPWQVLGKRVLYSSPWMNLEHWDVQLPDGSRIPDHHVLTLPREAVGVIPVGAEGRLLFIDHYRFQTDSRGWEIPAGQIEEGETLEWWWRAE